MNDRMGPRYILKDAHQISQLELEYQHHLKRLENIKHADNLKKTEKADQDLERLKQVKINNLRFTSSERLNAIDRENQILLERLIHLSKTPNKDMMPIKSESALGKMLHLSYRKKQQERIAYDNKLFAKRLMTQKPMFDKKKYEIEYEKHHKLMKQMQKLGAPKKLPPIELKKREMGFNLSIDLNPDYIGKKMHPSVSVTPKQFTSSSQQNSILHRRNQSVATISTNRNPINHIGGRSGSVSTKNASASKFEDKEAYKVTEIEKKEQTEEVKPNEQIAENDANPDTGVVEEKNAVEKNETVKEGAEQSDIKGQDQTAEQKPENGQVGEEIVGESQ